MLGTVGLNIFLHLPADSVQITGLYRWRPPIVALRVEIAAPRGYLKPYLDTILILTRTFIKFSYNS